jgi:MFS family permease
MSYPCFVQMLNKIARPGSASGPGRAERRHPSLHALRVALTVFFALDGYLFASWAVRVPAIKAQVGASPAALGLALLGLSAGSIATMTLSGTLCRRLGSRPVTVAAAVMLSLSLVLPTLAGTALELGLALAVLGIAYGGLNVAMNSVAVDLVAALRRPVMPSFHAAWSFGGLAGASAGGLLAPHLSPRSDLALVAVAGLVVTAIAGRVVLLFPGDTRQSPGPPAATASRRRIRLPGRAPALRSGAPHGSPEARSSAAQNRPPVAPSAGTHQSPGPRGMAWRVVGLFGLIALCSTYGEGAIADWGALHLREDLGAGAGLAAAGYAAFAVAEACGRLAGTRLLARYGEKRVLAGGGFIACAGMLAAALAPGHPAAVGLPLALAGFAATGLGVANIFPAAMTRAGLAAGPRGVAAASTLGYAGFLLGPPTIGLLASGIGLPAGLTTVSVLALIAAVLAGSAHRLAGETGEQAQ